MDSETSLSVAGHAIIARHYNGVLTSGKPAECDLNECSHSVQSPIGIVVGIEGLGAQSGGTDGAILGGTVDAKTADRQGAS